MKLPTVTGCAACQPTLLFEHAKPVNAHHYSVAWVHDPDVKVFMGTEEITNTVTEVVTGMGGWAIRLTEPPRLCPCGGHRVETSREFRDDFVVEINEEGQDIVTELAAEHQTGRCDRCELDMMLYGEAMWDRSTNKHLDVREVIRIRSQPDEEAIKGFRELVGLDASPVRVIDQAKLQSISLVERGPFDPCFIVRSEHTEPADMTEGAEIDFKLHGTGSVIPPRKP